MQGSCDPDDATCNKFYVDDLRLLGRDAVRSGTESFDNIPDARQFIRELRTNYPLPLCETFRKEQESSQGQTTTTTPPPAGPTTTTTANPSGGTTTTTPKTVETKPGVNCRNPREGGG